MIIIHIRTRVRYMKKNKLFLAILIALIALLAIGCGSGTNTSQEPAIKSNEATVSSGDKFAIPQESPTLIGKVNDITGNDITVYTVQVVPNAVPNGGAPNADGQRPARSNANQDQQGQRPRNRSAGLQFSEETKTFNVPAGIPVVTVQRGTNETTPVALSEIKKDQLLRVWEKDGAVNFVVVMGGNGPRTGAAGTGKGERPGNGQGVSGVGDVSNNTQ